VAAIMGGHFGRLWPWAAIGVVVVTTLSMTPLATNPMIKVRQALGLPTRNDRGKPPAAASDAELAAAQARLRPGLVAGIGVVAIALLVWLMEAKPF
jgi:hypothetical protein